MIARHALAQEEAEDPYGAEFGQDVINMAAENEGGGCAC